MPVWRNVSELSRVMPTLVVSTDDIRIAVLAAVPVRVLVGSFIIRLRICGMSDAMGHRKGALHRVAGAPR